MMSHNKVYSEDRQAFEPLFRVDTLTGCGNLLGFSEWITDNFKDQPRSPFSLMSLDINRFGELNQTRGHVQGDAALRWIGILLKETAQAPVYRIGGDELVAVFEGGPHSHHESQSRLIFDRLNQEADQIGLKIPAATITVIHYTGEENISPSEVFIQLGASIFEVKRQERKTFKVFQANRMEPDHNLAYLRWISGHLIHHMVDLGSVLDESHQMAYTDPITELPNQRAAQEQLERSLERASESGNPLSLLLIDGDDLRLYNQISYAAGDEMIQRLGATIQRNLRPGDFLARWRVGDEFLVLLPETDCQQAIRVGKRLCNAVVKASQEWFIPVSVSIGLASYPDHGSHPEVLLKQAEEANERAKRAGKNQVVSATSNGHGRGG